MKTALIPGCLLLCGLSGFAHRQEADTVKCIFPSATPGYDIPAYLKQNLHYPDSARKYNIEGRVFVRFTINEDGTPGDAKVIRGIGYGCDEEALRLIKNMPRWQPADTPGAWAREVFTQPILFKQE